MFDTKEKHYNPDIYEKDIFFDSNVDADISMQASTESKKDQKQDTAQQEQPKSSDRSVQRDVYNDPDKNNSNIELSYENTLAEVGRPLECTIVFDGNKTQNEHSKYEMLGIEEAKETVSYMISDDVLSYKTLTHILTSDEHKYGISCQSDGTCELYSMNEDRKAHSKLLGTLHYAKRIMDPMFAFIEQSNLYIIFNIPTQTAIDMGTNGRRPVFSDDDTVLASGMPAVFCFNLETSEITTISPKMATMSRYVCYVINTPENIPALLVINILQHNKVKKEEERPTFKQLIKMFVEDEPTQPKKATPFKTGISGLIIQPKTKYDLIPLTGDDKYGIARIDFTKSDNGLNSIAISWIDPECENITETTDVTNENTENSEKD